MCGIAGIYSYRDSAPPVDREELLRIREAMLKRGPDGAGIWISSGQRIAVPVSNGQYDGFGTK